jgi:hypothetical protein
VLSELGRIEKERWENDKILYVKRMADFQRFRRSLLLPSDATLEKVNRYEVAMERSFHKTLHELQRLQATRNGQAVSAPVAVDETLSRGASR